MSVFYSSETGDTSNTRMIAPFAAGVLLVLIAAAGAGFADWLAIAAGALALVMFVWWIINLLSWMRDQDLSRQERLAKLDPLVLQHEAMTALERQRADLLRLAVELDGKQIELIREMGALPSVTVRGGNTVLIGTWLELGQARIPWAFCAEWAALYEQRQGALPPVGHWSDSRARGYAQAILDWLAEQRVIMPAAGNQPAKWAPGMSERARAAALERSGVTWAAYWWETYTERDEGGADNAIS